MEKVQVSVSLYLVCVRVCMRACVFVLVLVFVLSLRCVCCTAGSQTTVALSLVFRCGGSGAEQAQGAASPSMERLMDWLSDYFIASALILGPSLQPLSCLAQQITHCSTWPRTTPSRTKLTPSGAASMALNQRPKRTGNSKRHAFVFRGARPSAPPNHRAFQSITAVWGTEQGRMEQLLTRIELDRAYYFMRAQQTSLTSTLKGAPDARQRALM